MNKTPVRFMRKNFSPEDQKAIRLLPQSIAVGLCAGLVVSAYRYLIPLIGRYYQRLFNAALPLPLRLLLSVTLMCLTALFVSCMVRHEPMISGSGIPQVRADLKGFIRLNWRRVLLLKFFGGLLSLGSGLTAGREGPSVQIGASVGQLLARLTKADKERTENAIVCGAASGLSAAFNAPLSGVLFTLEELHHGLPLFAIITALGASLSADFISSAVFGLKPVIKMPEFLEPDWRVYLLLPLLGLVCAISGILFNTLIMKGKKYFALLPLPAYWKRVIPFILTAIAIVLDPALFGSGETLIFLPQMGNPPTLRLLLLYIFKLILLLLAFCSGLPGGIFFPLLVLGSLSGNLLGTLLAAAGLLEHQWILGFSLLAMSAHFAAIVRAPLTGMMLIIEMTGSFEFFLPLGIVTFVAYVIPEFCHVKPIYDRLLEALVQDKNPGLFTESSASFSPPTATDPRGH